MLQAHSDDESDASKLDTVEETLTLFRLGMDAVAAQRGLKSTTIYGHLATAIACGEVQLNDVVTLAEHELRTIETAFEQCGNGKQIKPVFEALGGEYDYGVLRCVQAALLGDEVVE